MTDPRLERYRFYADESILGVGRALAIARHDVLHPGHRDFPEVPPGTKDPVWMPVAARLGLVVLARDKRIRTRPGELEVYRREGLRAFWLAGKKDPPMSSWTYLCRLAKWWPRIEEIAAERGPGPWFYSIGDTLGL